MKKFVLIGIALWLILIIWIALWATGLAASVLAEDLRNRVEQQFDKKEDRIDERLNNKRERIKERLGAKADKRRNWPSGSTRQNRRAPREEGNRIDNRLDRKEFRGEKAERIEEILDKKGR